MLLLDYQNVLIESLLKDRFSSRYDPFVVNYRAIGRFLPPED